MNKTFQFFRKIVSFLPALLVIILLFVLSKNIPGRQISDFVKQTGVFGPIVFILISLLTYVIAPLSGSPILFVGYQLFGNSVIFLTTIAAFISFNINFWLARIYGRPFVEKMIGKAGVTKMDKMIENYGLVSLFFLRIFQGSLHDFISLAAGLTSMKFIPYVTVSALAIIPGTTLWYLLAHKVNSPTTFTLLSLFMAGAFSLTFLIGQRLYMLIKRQNSKFLNGS